MIMSFSLKEVGGTDGWVYPSPHNQKNFQKKNFKNFSKKIFKKILEKNFVKR